MTKSIAVSEELWERLMQEKLETKAKSLEAVILNLFSRLKK